MALTDPIHRSIHTFMHIYAIATVGFASAMQNVTTWRSQIDRMHYACRPDAHHMRIPYHRAYKNQPWLQQSCQIAAAADESQ